MSTSQTTPDTVTITCVRPALNQTITVTLPEPIVQMLQYLSDNVTVPDPQNLGQMKKKYSYALNVIWTDVIALLLPIWQQQYVMALTQPQIDQIQTAMNSQVKAAVDAISVIGPTTENPA